jgi:hypothetical protein
MRAYLKVFGIVEKFLKAYKTFIPFRRMEKSIVRFVIEPNLSL